ncbi:hypothetical protein CRG98_004412 [Punica granatum]|uniref:Uncharacterized protein n=1 Tax=Punica granatum TaxID=22663 RepID=A0A2I0L3B0_PUNGR|nr:hypothetical protein CRG98_004412 [Punica granatum]
MGYLLDVESGLCWAETAIGVACRSLCDQGARLMIASRAVMRALICQKPVSQLGRLLVRWRCPDLVVRDLSSRVERLCTPRDRESESAVVFATCGTCDRVIIRCRRAAAFVTRMGISVQIWSNIGLVIVRTRMWTLVGARIARIWIVRLGSVHLPGDA